VTAPIVPDRRTTGTTADARRKRAGSSLVIAAFKLDSLIQISSTLTNSYHAAVIEPRDAFSV
jgi:hypothetical protein